jgi:Rne/Rng family ribonuclease
MSKELFVSSTPHETKVAVTEEDQLAEIYYERENEYTLAGSIYKGRVTRVLPGMQSAFVNIGLERDAFLYVSDFLLEEEEEDTEGLERAVARSRPVIAEPQEPAEMGQSGLLEADEIIPPAEQAHGDEQEEEHSASDSAPAEDAEREGARKWRGRRRRGRGGRFQEREERDRPAEAAQDRSTEPRQESRHERRPETHPELEPIVLPGESISKYRPQGESRPTEPQAPPPPKRNNPRPSTEYSLNAAEFAPGSMVLPGETIAKYKSEPHSASATKAGATISSATSVADAQEAAHEQGEAPEYGAAALPAPGTGEPAEAEVHQHETAETEIAPAMGQRYETAPPHEEERYDHMNVASVFGGDAVEPEPEATTHPPAEQESSQPEHQEMAETQAEEAHTAAESGGPWQASGTGVVEEEEIEDEELELPGFEEHFDLAEFEELEEQELGPGDDQMVPMGSELTEAVRDAHVIEHATGQYEAEGLEGHEEFEGEESSASEEEAAYEAEEADELEDESLEGARAEHRSAAGTAGYQQQQRTERGPQDRRGGRRAGRRMRGRRQFAPRQMPAISDLLKEGQEILVQIAKEPIAKKGARITSHIALPGRFLVYMPTVHHTGVSRKIASEEERHRLKRIVMSERGEANGGFIVRTAAAGANEDDLRADIRFLINLWNEIKARADKAKAPALIYHDLNLVERILRDQVSGSFSHIWADTEQEYERILRFVSRFQPSLVKRVKLYSKETPLFEQFNITDEINKALKSKVWLKSGGYIVINQTEALVAIDINTGKYVGKTARLEDTIVKTNIDAIKEIVRQIRLRDLGGIIVIDFIDMDERKNRQKVMQALEDALKADRAPSKVLQFNDFGLVAITRKRVKQSLERTLGQPCPTCQATGMIKSVSTVCNEIYVEMRKMARHFERDVMLRVNPEVGKALKSNGGRWLQEMEDLTKRTILVKSDALLHPEQFDIQ